MLGIVAFSAGTSEGTILPATTGSFGRNLTCLADKQRGNACTVITSLPTRWHWIKYSPPM